MIKHMRASHPLYNWEHTPEQKLAALRSVGDMNIQTNAGQHIFEVNSYLNYLDPKAVRVERYACGLMGSAPERQYMKSLRQPADVSGSYIYSASAPATRPLTSSRYAGELARPSTPVSLAVPFTGVAIPQEDARFLWQR